MSYIFFRVQRNSLKKWTSQHRAEIRQKILQHTEVNQLNAAKGIELQIEQFNVALEVLQKGQKVKVQYVQKAAKVQQLLEQTYEQLGGKCPLCHQGLKMPHIHREIP